MTRTFYFVRHGEARSNVTGILEGAASPLTDKGKEQSAFLAKRFKTIPIDLIIASPYVRTKDTAEIFNRELQKPVVYSDLIVEISNPSELVGLQANDPKRIEIQRARVEQHRHDPNWKYSDEESFVELKTRAAQALEFLLSQKEDRVAVITHGAILRLMIAYMLHGKELTPKAFWNILTFFKSANTGITLCEYDPDRAVRSGWWMRTWSDHAHLGEVE